MANILQLPLLSDTMEEGVIADVFFKKGDKISGGDVIAEVETDKATMEVEAYDEHEGTLLYVAKKGDAVPVGGVLAITGKEGEDVEAILKEHASGSSSKDDSETEETATDSQTEEADSGEEINLDNVKVIQMPLLSDTMDEGIIADTFFNAGDSIEGGAILAEVETDKATMEVQAYDEHEGVLRYIAKAGDAVPVGGVLAITTKKDVEIDVDAVLNQMKKGKQTEKKEEESTTSKNQPQEVVDQAQEKTEQTVSANGRIFASPLAKRMANENGLDLSLIKGTGDNGRIVKRDVEKAIEQGTAKVGAPQAKVAQDHDASDFISVAPTGQEQTEEQRVSQMRKTIAKRLAESKYSAPHFYLTIEVNMINMMAARKRMNELSPEKISYNDLVMKAAAMALRQHPAVNSSWQGDKILVNKHVHIGMAVAVDTGLVVPVLRFADNMPLSQMAKVSGEMATKAREGNLTLDEMQGATFSVSNLGSMGIEEFTAIINPPNAAILAVGGINKRMRMVGDEMKPVDVMKLTLSCDHRVVDGYVGSQYLQTFKKYMENPSLMLV